MTVTNKTVTTNTASQRTTNLRFTVTPSDPCDTGSSDTSTSANRLYDSYGTNSSDQREQFDDENRRMGDDGGGSGAWDTCPGTITGQWTSSTALSNGEAQVHNGQLQYPTVNWSSGYLPTGSPNYSAFSGDQVYYRAFEDSGTAHSSGQLELDGLTGSDVGALGAGNINVELKLCDGETGWLDLGTAFDSGTFTGADGDGIQTSQSGDLWGWSVGTKSTTNSDDMYMLRVTFRNSTDKINEIEEVGW